MAGTNYCDTFLVSFHVLSEATVLFLSFSLVRMLCSRDEAGLGSGARVVGCGRVVGIESGGLDCQAQLRFHLGSNEPWRFLGGGIWMLWGQVVSGREGRVPGGRSAGSGGLAQG